MYRLTDRQVALVAYGAMIQAADDYHEWRRCQERGWRTTGRAASKRRRASPVKPMPRHAIARFEKWGTDARDWFLGETFGGLSFKACCEALGYDPVWLGARIMTAEFWEILNAKGENIVNVRSAFDEAAKESMQEAA